MDKKNIILPLLLGAFSSTALANTFEYSVVPELSMYTRSSVNFTLIKAEDSALPDECVNKTLASTNDIVTTYLQRKASKSTAITGIYFVYEDDLDPGRVFCDLIGIK